MAYSFTTDTVADIPVRSAELFGDLPALGMASGTPLTYREVEYFSRRAAAALQLAGVRKGDRVAIISENRPEWGVASFAVARAGAVAVPILIDFPDEQVANILEHSGARVVFASKRQRKKLEESLLGSLTLLPIEDLAASGAEAGPAEAAERFVAPELGPEDLAAIVYTSGTTGRSKGVMLTHRNYIADALACGSVIVLSPRDLLLSILPLAHAYEYTIGFLIPAMSGAQVRYLDRPPSATALLPALRELRPTIVLSVPLIIEKIYRSAVLPSLSKIGLYRTPLFRPLLERIAGKKLLRTFGGRLRFFGIGGAALDAEVERFLITARFPHAIGYGLTETAPIIAAAAVGKTRQRMAGSPIGDAEIRIADADAEGVGEVQVRGSMVGPGYYRDEERTREAFTEDLWFRTGDLGHLDGEGKLFIKGRLKTMILGASGENIYPEEIEAVLNDSPYVMESLVYGDGEGLTALVQLKPEVRDALAALVSGGIEGAEKAAALLGAAGRAVASTEHAAAALLDRIRQDANRRLAAFSRIRRVELQSEPFEKTPTQKIKRFLYPRNGDGRNGKADAAE
jgi:long-chain acyl-CoA synthetase